jgi:hypothetical protein
LENKDPLSPTGEEPGSDSPAENQDLFQGPENKDLFFQKGGEPNPFSCRVKNNNLSRRVQGCGVKDLFPRGIREPGSFSLGMGNQDLFPPERADSKDLVPPAR